MDRLNRGLGLSVNGNMRYIQIMIRSPDLMEGVVKAFSKGAFKLWKKGVGVTVLTYRFLLRLLEMLLSITDFLSLSSKTCFNNFVYFSNSPLASSDKASFFSWTSSRLSTHLAYPHLTLPLPLYGLMTSHGSGKAPSTPSSLTLPKDVMVSSKTSWRKGKKKKESGRT